MAAKKIGLLLCGCVATVSLAATTPQAYEERPLLSPLQETLPGLGMWYVGPRENMRVFGTKESAGDLVAMMVYTPEERADSFGRMVAYGDFIRYDGDVNDYADWDGISFVFRGDGSDAFGFLGLHPDMSMGVRFPLGLTRWQQIAVRWQEMTPHEPDIKRPCHAVHIGIGVPRQTVNMYQIQQVEFVPREEELYTRVARPASDITPETIYHGMPGFVISKTRAEIEASRGIRFNVRGGGGTVPARLYWHGQNATAMRFVPRQDSWNNRAIAWEELPPPEVGDPVFLVFDMDPKVTLGHRYLIDRISLWRGDPRKAPEIRPTLPDVFDREAMAFDFHSRTEKLGPVRALLREKQDVQVAVVGDSIGAGEHLELINQEAQASYHRTFGGRLFYSLAKYHEYRRGQLIFETYNPRTMKWESLNRTAPYSSGLTVAAMSVRGTSMELFERGLRRALTYRPHVIVLQLGANHIIYGTIEQYERDLRSLIEKSRSANVQVLLTTPIPVSDPLPRTNIPEGSYLERGEAYAERVRAIAEELQLPLVDLHAALRARGTLRMGEIYWDRVHLNYKGHRFVAALIGSALSNVPHAIWNETPELISERVLLAPQLPEREKILMPLSEPIIPNFLDENGS